jgi:tRNA threonylcarbamoyl adenosine modification protein (Sua5/YciO/YrdC/YwlC family)
VTAGGVIVLPTDTVYGLACLPEHAGAIFELKGRPREKHVQLLVSDPAELERLGSPTPGALRLAATFWPGPLTLVIASGEETVGVRMPDHAVALDVLARTGPLAASSANRSGEPTPATCREIEDLFGERVDAYIDGGAIVGSGSTVVDMTGDEPVVLRAGPITLEDVTRALQ